MSEIIKKNWFVGLVALFLFAGVIYFATDAIKTDVKALQTEDGKDVVFSYADQNYTADDMYDEVYQTLDIGVIIPVLELEVYRDAMEVTDAIKSDVDLNSQNIVTSLKNEYGEQWEFALDRLLVQSGYVTKSGTAGLKDYLTIMEVRNFIEKEYVKNNPNSYKAYMEENKPRLISHILVKMVDKDNPTAAENEKLEKVKEALAKPGAVFATVAAEFSDDGSAENGGSLGLNNVESVKKFVPEFQEQVYTVDAGETTEWFKTDYGYHIIRVDATDLEGFEKLNNFDFYNLVFDANPEMLLDITWEQIQKQDIKFGDNQELNDAIIKHYTIKEEN